MIVCVCNRLNETKIAAALASGVRSADDVYACHGVKRKCGTCLTTIQTMLEDARQAGEALQAAE